MILRFKVDNIEKKQIFTVFFFLKYYCHCIPCVYSTGHAGGRQAGFAKYATQGWWARLGPYICLPYLITRRRVKPEANLL